MEAFRLEGGVMAPLGDLPGGEVFSQALAVSGDGLSVVGWGTTGSPAEFNREAFIWTASEGVQRLQSRLEDGGLDPSGWILEEATDISSDGRTIVGFGTNPAGETEAWIAVVPEPSAELFLGVAIALLVLLRMNRRNDSANWKAGLA